MQAARELGVTILRRPGENFVSGYIGNQENNFETFLAASHDIDLITLRGSHLGETLLLRSPVFVVWNEPGESDREVYCGRRLRADPAPRARGVDQKTVEDIVEAGSSRAASPSDSA
jgi:hypothetical protein